MKCLHCLVEFHPKEDVTVLGKDADGGWAIRRLDCPACSRMNLYLINGEVVWHPGVGKFHITRVLSSVSVRPKGSNRPPCPAEVPAGLSEDYTEACIVLPDSPKASAALSRRCLQNLLREAAKAGPADLSTEIQQVLDSRQLPSHLADEIDAIRHIGNFAAHPLKSTSTGEILPVEPEEAGWNLDVLEGLFDFYYVQPAVAAKKKAALNAKLADVGKKPMK